MPSPIDDETLQRFHDGDLSPAEARGLSDRIASDPAAQQRLRALQDLRALIRDAAHQIGDELDSDALFNAIEARLPQRAAPSIMPPAPANVRPLRRRGVWFPALAATAVAAATLLVVLRSGEQDGGGGEAIPPQIGMQMEALNERSGEDEGQGVGVQTYGERVGGAADAALVSTARGSRLEHVDFGHNAGTAFLIDDEVGVTVVWLNEPSESSDEDGQ